MRAPSFARSKPVKRLSMLPVRSINSTNCRMPMRTGAAAPARGPCGFLFAARVSAPFFALIAVYSIAHRPPANKKSTMPKRRFNKKTNPPILLVSRIRCVRKAWNPPRNAE